MKKYFIFLAAVLFLLVAKNTLAYQPSLVFLQPAGAQIQINNPENLQYFFDTLSGKPRDYFINSAKDFELDLNFLVPASDNPDDKYSATVYSVVDGKDSVIFSNADSTSIWQEVFDSFGRDYFLQGQGFEKQVPAGKYKIEVSSPNPPRLGEAGNPEKYILAVGKKQVYSVNSVLNIFWQLPLLKLTFLKTDVLQLFMTPFGIAGIGGLGALIILILLFNFIISSIKEKIKHSMAKTMLLTSGGMTMKEEIVSLLQKPAYDVTVGFINTAYKFQEEAGVEYTNQDLETMKEVGFNVEEYDIQGKNEQQVFNFLKIKDIIFVAGGNTFYLLNAMRRCNFEKVLRKLLKQGIVYIGASAGSIVAGKTIQTAEWYGDQNVVKLRNLKGLNLVPFDIFAHYEPKYDEIIKQKIKNPKKRLKNLRILTDEQAVLVQGNEIDLIGKGEQIII